MTATSVANAQPSERFPESTTIQIDGERHEAFDLGGFRALLKIDAELSIASRLVSNLQDQVQEYRLLDERLQLALSEREAQIDILQAERERLIERWTEENKLRLEAENKPSIGSWLGFTLAGGFGVATVVLLVILLAGG